MLTLIETKFNGFPAYVVSFSDDGSGRFYIEEVQYKHWFKVRTKYRVRFTMITAMCLTDNIKAEFPTLDEAVRELRCLATKYANKFGTYKIKHAGD